MGANFSFHDQERISGVTIKLLYFTQQEMPGHCHISMSSLTFYFLQTTPWCGHSKVYVVMPIYLAKEPLGMSTLLFSQIMPQ